MSTAEFQRISLIAAGVDPSQIPSILSTAIWRHLMISALNSITSERNVFSDDIEITDPASGIIFEDSTGVRRRLRVDDDGNTMTEVLP